MPSPTLRAGTRQSAHPDFGPDCRDFLQGVESGTFQGVTSTVVLNEILYVLQIQRAAQLLGTMNRGVIHARLAADPAVAAASWLTAEQFLNLLDALQHGGLTVIELEQDHYRDACAVGRQFSLFISDATHVAICRQLGIVHVASNDSDPDGAVDRASAWAGPVLPLPDGGKAFGANWRYRATLGLALYRAGRYAAAIRRAQESLAASPEGANGSNWLLGMAHRRLGQAADARRWLTKGLGWQASAVPDWHDRLLYRLLRREAEALLR